MDFFVLVTCDIVTGMLQNNVFIMHNVLLCPFFFFAHYRFRTLVLIYNEHYLLKFAFVMVTRSSPKRRVSLSPLFNLKCFTKSSVTRSFCYDNRKYVYKQYNSSY